MSSRGGWAPYVPVAKRRVDAARKMKKLKKTGQDIQPIEIEGRTISKSFWGKAWCDHLESYSDFENRLPRGRTYVRNGSVVDLHITAGKVTAMVSGSSLYKIDITIRPAEPQHWKKMVNACAGKIDSMIELLQGKFSKSVMEVMTDKTQGLFPKLSEIEMSCSCPDWARMCKHVAAVLYGVGSRLDRKPEHLFLLRQVNHLDLINTADVQALKGKATKRPAMAEAELEDIFGIDIADADISFQKKKVMGKKKVQTKKASKPKKKARTLLK